MRFSLPTITDPDNDKYSITLINKPNFIDYSSGTLTFIPAKYQIGMHFFTINLKDENNYGALDKNYTV